MQQALQHCQAVLEARRRLDAAAGLTSPGPATLTSLQSVGMVLRALGRPGESLVLLREALGGMEAAHGRASKAALRCAGAWAVLRKSMIHEGKVEEGQEGEQEGLGDAVGCCGEQQQCEQRLARAGI